MVIAEFKTVVENGNLIIPPDVINRINGHVTILVLQDEKKLELDEVKTNFFNFIKKEKFILPENYQFNRDDLNAR